MPAKPPTKPPAKMSAKTPGKPKTPANLVLPTQGRKAGSGRKASVGEKVVGKVVEQVVDINPIEPVVQTRRGRNVVKAKAFELFGNSIGGLLNI
jgi:hypothetical protein